MPFYFWLPKHRSTKIEIGTENKKGGLQLSGLTESRISSVKNFFTEISEELNIYVN